MIAAVVDAALHAIAAGIVAGLALFVLVAVIVRVLVLDATVRHALWTVALCATALIPCGTLAVSAARAPATAPFAGPSAGSGPPAHDAVHGARGGLDVSAYPTARPALASLGPLGRAVGWQPQLAHEAALVITAVWLAGALTGLGGLALSLRRVGGLKRRSSPLDAKLAAELPWLTETGAREREIYLRLSYEIETPVAIGFRRPVILIPTELATGGGLAAIEGLVLHEHAHLRRRDDWTNLVGRLIERVFWFNPIVWIIGRRIALEREIAADDAVVDALGEPHAYAKSLWQLAREMRMPEHAVVAPGAFFTRKHISIRIEALLERRPVRGSGRRIAAATVALSAIGCTVAAAATAPGINIPPPPVAAARVATAPAAPTAPRVVVHVSRAAAVVADCTDCKPAAAHAPARPPHNMLPDADYDGSDLRNVDWRGRTLRGISFSGADLRGARLDGARFEGVDLAAARLDNASLTNAVLIGSTIEGASLRGANTRGLRMTGVSLSGLDMRGLDVRTMLDGCDGCDLEGANLAGADLRAIRLTAASLEGADLHGADLRGSTFTHVDLQGANLSRTDVRDATFDGCSLEGADFGGADTRTTNFHGSNLTATNLSEAH